MIFIKHFSYLKAGIKLSYMKKIDRRSFIQTGIAGIAGISLMGAGIDGTEIHEAEKAIVDLVKLGNTGLQVPRMAFGTGSIGGNQQSNQTRLGKDKFIELASHAWDRGVRFFDTADSYGSHTFAREVLKKVPREKTTLMSKMWTTDTSWQKSGDVAKTLDRFRMETGSDYFDILLMHCMTNGKWQEEKKLFIEGFSKAKQQGIVKAVGVSCHNWDAMKVAVEDPWVDVILARINPFNAHMDGTPEAIMGLLETARKNGKGIIGMKIFGNGDKTTEEEREKSITYAIRSGNVHCMTMGMESIEQIDDAVERVMRIAKA
jgi:predicted aldo/keto reductase-like oxidoreductase